MLETVLEIVVSVGIGIYGLRRFFVLRKYWQFRHERVATESISVIARLISLGATVPFLIKFIFVDKNLILITKELIDVLITGSILAIGAGLWLQANQNSNPLKILMNALRQERKEAMRVQENSELFQVLGRLLGVAQKLDEGATETLDRFLNEFALSWRVTIETDTMRSATLNNLVTQYITLEPFVEQTAQLKDLLSLRMWSSTDESVASTLQTAITQLEAYIGTEYQVYEVVIVPQNQDQRTQIDNMPSARSLQERNGGVAYSVGGFNSKHIANTVSLRLTQKAFFSIVEPAQPNK